jgi:hypothetical protein
MNWFLSRYIKHNSYISFDPSYIMFCLVITNIWQKVNDVALAAYSTIFLIFVDVIFRQKAFFQVFSSTYAVFFRFMSHMTYYYYYHLFCEIFCDFQNIFNESISQKSMLILDDKTLAYLWRIKFIFIYYFVVFYFVIMFYCLQTLSNYLDIQSFYFECTWWRLFQ